MNHWEGEVFLASRLDFRQMPSGSLGHVVLQNAEIMWRQDVTMHLHPRYSTNMNFLSMVLFSGED